jgi:hypothetical protein
MEFISVGQTAEGFIAIGQHARGVFALGQEAVGVVAVGQLARGCFTLGQVAFGFIGWGQVGFGMLHAVGMFGVGGRGFGLVIPLTPGVGRARVAPNTVDVQSALRGTSGWIETDLYFDSHGLGLANDGHRLPVKFDRRLQGGAQHLTAHGPKRVWAFLRTVRGIVVCDRIQHAPPRPFERAGFYGLAAVQFVGLVIMAVVWWMLVGVELAGILDKVFSS